MAINVESEKALLKKEAVFQHLDRIVDRVIAEKPADAHKLIEVFSRLVKNPTPQPAPADEKEMEARAKYVKRVRKLDQVPTTGEGGEVAPVCAIPDFMEEAEMLSWAGAGFGELESYKIMCSLRKLADKQKDLGLVKLRLWGKVLGTHRDYYVAEAQRDGGGEGEGGEEGDPDPPEASGIGANAYTYFVTNDLCGLWKKLPDVKPREIVASRKIKKMLSGSLDTPVVTHPHFPGKENVLLRAMIARITSDTVLCVKGYLINGSEDPEVVEIKEDEEFKCPLPAELLNPKAWTHMQPHILLNGKTTHPEIPEEEEGEDANNDGRKKLLAAIEADPVRDILRDITGDQLKWIVKQAGDTALYRNPRDKAGPPKSNAVTFVQSLSWQGAVCVARGGHFANLYVGHGLPAGGPDFFICAPPDMQEEPEEVEDQPEPQGSAEQEAPAEGGEEG